MKLYGLHYSINDVEFCNSCTAMTPNSLTDHGQSFEAKILTKIYMDKAGAETFNLPTLAFQVRMRLATLFAQSILFRIGRGECPITGMTGVVYFDDYDKCPLQVHRIFLAKDAYHYD